MFLSKFYPMCFIHCSVFLRIAFNYISSIRIVMFIDKQLAVILQLLCKYKVHYHVKVVVT